MNNADIPAMPLSLELNEKLEEGYWYEGLGLTKREYFAGLVMQGMCSNEEYAPVHQDHFVNVAEDAVRQADALLAELEKQN